MKQLVIGTNSPRRQQLMRDLGFEFSIMKLEVDEAIGEGIVSSEGMAKYLSEVKNKAYRADLKDEILLTADTIVINDGQVLGKPKDEKEAFQMIRSMCGKSHQVISGVCISTSDKSISFDDVVNVTMSNISDDEIRCYIEHYKPYDKAGAYGIQEWIGMVAIESIKGSFYTVMGLPVQKVYNVLKNEFGLSPIKI